MQWLVCVSMCLEYLETRLQFIHITLFQLFLLILTCGPHPTMMYEREKPSEALFFVHVNLQRGDIIVLFLAFLHFLFHGFREGKTLRRLCPFGARERCSGSCFAWLPLFSYITFSLHGLDEREDWLVVCILYCLT